MLISTEVWVILGSKNVKWYETKGYDIPKYINKKGEERYIRGEKIIVKTEDLQDKSRAFVDVKCDGCGEILTNIRWSDYTSQVRDNGKYYCLRCANAGDKQWTSFYKWCYANLLKELADYILSRWDYKLNKCTPKDVSYASQGINRKGYWFKCLEHPEHKSEQKRISAFTGGQKGSINCDQCNSIFVKFNHLVKYFVNIDDALKYSFGSGEYVLTKCPDCGQEKEIKVSNLVNHGFGCGKCGDGVSMPEKVMINVFEQLNKNFIMQLSKRTFKWVGDYRYDFYIEEIEGICECHGNQHYEEINGNWGTLKEIQDNDFDKEWLARENKISNYIILNCRHSDISWIKNNIMNSSLPKLLNFKEEDIDWVKCDEAGCKNLVKVACDLWNEGIKSTSEISNVLNLSSSAIRSYLKKGTELGWCNYNPKEELCEKVICITTGEVFNSIHEASLNGRESIRVNISACCKGKHKSAGKSEIGEPLVWMYYDQYLLKTEDEIKYTLANAQVENYNHYKKKVICLTTNETFESMVEAKIKYNIDGSGISQCCSGVQKSAGKHPKTGEKLIWDYYEE